MPETRKSQEIVQCREELKKMDSEQLREFMHKKLLERVRQGTNENITIANKINEL